MHPLITGANGFLGCELVRQFHTQGVKVTAAVGPNQNDLEHRRLETLRALGVRILNCDLRHAAPLEEVPAHWDTLYHLAAYVKTEEASDDVHINDLGTERLLRQLPLAGKQVVFTSTLAVADNAPGGAITSDTPCHPRTAYGATKLAAESLVRTLCREGKARHLIVRMPTLYGPGYRLNGIFDVLPLQLRQQRPLARVAWPGRLALLAVEDAAKILRLAASNREAWDQTLLASSNENPTTWEIAQAIAAAQKIPYHRIRLPHLLARTLALLLGGWWQSPVVPNNLQILAWRARLLLNGLHCRGDRLLQLANVTPREWRAGFTRMYEQDRREVNAQEG